MCSLLYIGKDTPKEELFTHCEVYRFNVNLFSIRVYTFVSQTDYNHYF